MGRAGVYRLATGSSTEPLDIGVLRYRLPPRLFQYLGGTMSRRLTVLLLAMLTLAGAMSLKTVVSAHANSPVIVAGGGAPVPPPF